MTKAAEQERPLDGTVGGALDQAGNAGNDRAGELDPESLENRDEDRDQPVDLKPSPELDTKIKDAMDKIIELKQSRSAINASISTIIEDLAAEGINRHAFRLSLRYYEMPEEQREGLDFSYNITRRASGHPVQTSLDLVVDNTETGGD